MRRPGGPAAVLPAILAAAALALALLVAAHPALAQAHNPFGVGISEGGGQAGGISGWLIGQQTVFERRLSSAVRAARDGGPALWWLTGLGFAYGVFHAAGPGHGKAVMASYLFANERALRRGMVLTLLAALLQGLVAVLLVGVLAVIFNVTASRMKDAASLVEVVSYAGITLFGAWLVWHKGRRLWALLRQDASRGFGLAFPQGQAVALAGGAAFAPLAATPRAARAEACGCERPAGFVADAGHGAACGHVHGPDPATLGHGFVWREAALTVVAAGLRPCSGAILVLVFALAQGIFASGVLAVLAMALGTALTTGALAAVAVLARAVAVKALGPGSRRGALLLAGLEAAAAAVVLLVGLSLVLGTGSLGGA